MLLLLCRRAAYAVTTLTRRDATRWFIRERIEAIMNERGNIHDVTPARVEYWR